MTREELCIQACQYAVGELTRKGSYAFITSAHAGRQQISWIEVVEWLKDYKRLLEQESKTGHWVVEVWNNKEHRTCSVCQRMVDYEPYYHYCPCCGAKMEEESEDEK